MLKKETWTEKKNTFRLSHCAWPQNMPLSPCDTASLKLITLGLAPVLPSSPSNRNALCQCPPFSHAEMVALKLITLGLAPALHLSTSNDNARCQCSPFSHVEMFALKLFPSDVPPALCMSPSPDTARCSGSPLSQTRGRPCVEANTSKRHARPACHRAMTMRAVPDRSLHAPRLLR